MLTKILNRLATKYMIAFVEWVGVGCLGTGIGGSLGYYTGRDYLFNHYFNKNDGMAFSTAVAITFIGIALITTSVILKRHEQHIRQV